MSISGISGISKGLGSLNYDADKARRDLIAGLTVAAVSLPQGITYALVAGVDPKFGVYSAIVVTFVASVFGSSSHLVNGPTSAISLLVFSSLAFLDPENRTVLFEALFLLGVLVGTFQILIAVFKLGDLTRYISESVILGFLLSAAILIALGQLGNGATALQNQLTFVQNLQDTLDTGIGNLVNANLGKESAQLTALQTKQQLGIQALSIANQSSSVLLSLFR